MGHRATDATRPGSDPYGRSISSEISPITSDRMDAKERFLQVSPAIDLGEKTTAIVLAVHHFHTSLNRSDRMSISSDDTTGSSAEKIHFSWDPSTLMHIR